MAIGALVPPDATRVATVYTNGPKRLRGAVFADLCTLLRHHTCPQRRNSVHKCPKTAPRDHFRRSVYTLLHPPRLLARPGGATGPTTSATPWPRDARALGPDTHAARAVTQPLTHTNSRSLVKQRIIARHIRGNTIPLAAVRGLHVRMAAQGLRTR